MKRLKCACGRWRQVEDDWNEGNIWACIDCKPHLWCRVCSTLDYPEMCEAHTVV